MIGCRWRVGDGSHIKVMNEHWLRGKGERCLGGPQGQDAYDLYIKNFMLSLSYCG